MLQDIHPHIGFPPLPGRLAAAELMPVDLLRLHRPDCYRQRQQDQHRSPPQPGPLEPSRNLPSHAPSHRPVLLPPPPIPTTSDRGKGNMTVPNGSCRGTGWVPGL